MFFPSAKIILHHPDDKNRILLIKRTVHGTVSYEPAGGRVEIDFERKTAESLEACAVREVQEELGITATIDGYLGSYYFFWTIDPTKCSSCAVFVGSIQHKNTSFTTNADTNELPLEPAWITRDDLANGRVPISTQHVGLEQLLQNYFANNR